ncbi:hypothetical protein LCGC14_1984050, partial [marine sediment metagenome]
SPRDGNCPVFAFLDHFEVPDLCKEPLLMLYITMLGLRPEKTAHEWCEAER